MSAIHSLLTTTSNSRSDQVSPSTRSSNNDHKMVEQKDIAEAATNILTRRPLCKVEGCNGESTQGVSTCKKHTRLRALHRRRALEAAYVAGTLPRPPCTIPHCQNPPAPHKSWCQPHVALAQSLGNWARGIQPDRNWLDGCRLCTAQATGGLRFCGECIAYFEANRNPTRRKEGVRAEINVNVSGVKHQSSNNQKASQMDETASTSRADATSNSDLGKLAEAASRVLAQDDADGQVPSDIPHEVIPAATSCMDVDSGHDSILGETDTQAQTLLLPINVGFGPAAMDVDSDPGNTIGGTSAQAHISLPPINIGPDNTVAENGAQTQISLPSIDIGFGPWIE
ncbi:hypothetical protein SUNI508_00193 [Seiridium unicorne]|uniref:Uncharacterized protein n=1 Tax=Seiridium unicorne TaxID=138068 RepID=A0ABR2VIQ9_9PEZI